jgi:hypothetical protein
MENRGARLLLELAIGFALLGVILLPRYFQRDESRARNARPPIEHVVLVVLPRGPRSEVQVRAFAKRGVLLANSHALVHPAAPNRVALLAGSVHGGRQIGELLDAKRLRWRVCGDKPSECADDVGAFAFTYIPAPSLPHIDPLPPRTLMIVTIDEGRGSTNDILTAIAGDGVRAGATSRAWYDHYSVLRTIEELLHLGTLTAHDARADVIDDIWR